MPRARPKRPPNPVTAIGGDPGAELVEAFQRVAAEPSPVKSYLLIAMHEDGDTTVSRNWHCMRDLMGVLTAELFHVAAKYERQVRS